MVMVFDKYAEYYDLLYRDKDYEGECDFVEAIFRMYSESPVKSVLDMGCGTGGHSIPLSHRGYDVVAVDRSSEMLKRARAKASANKCKIRFKCEDLRELRLGRSFDAVLALFNVAGYQKENEDMHQMLDTACTHLREGGLLIFDFWFGPAVMTERPVARLKEAVSGDLSVLRFAEPMLDTYGNRVHVKYRVLCNKGRTMIADIVETHEVRFFFWPEIIEFLKYHHMEKLHFCEWMRLDGNPGEGNWNVCVAARKMGRRG